MCPTKNLVRSLSVKINLEVFLAKVPYLSRTYDCFTCVLLGVEMSQNIATNQGVVGSIPASRTITKVL
jgi:hypothetical protein